MRLAIIPARGGSRRLPRKNVRAFHGEPLLQRAIALARSASSIDRVWVSTDDAAIASLARSAGADVPFTRPAALSDDHAVLADVMEHALEQAMQMSLDVTEACLVFATAPMLDPADLDRGLAVLLASEADQALAVTAYGFAPQRAQRIGDDGVLAYAQPEHRRTRSQDLEPLYHDAAQFVWGRRDSFRREACAAPVTVPVLVDAERVVDIDTLDDWHRAERRFHALRAA